MRARTSARVANKKHIMTLGGIRRPQGTLCDMRQALAINDGQIRPRATAVASDNTYINTQQGTIDHCCSTYIPLSTTVPYLSNEVDFLISR